MCPMKILSYNIRGWGNSAKRRRLNTLINSGVFDLCLLQETKRDIMDDYMIHNLWGHKDVQWVAKPAVGFSGGLLIIWNKDSLVYRFSFTGVG
ncbi:hypothetical protein QL285_031636 [Trifolium repens]|nr:hypothetical protein QL285_031636 [Trifolium repens]